MISHQVKSILSSIQLSQLSSAQRNKQTSEQTIERTNGQTNKKQASKQTNRQTNKSGAHSKKRKNKTMLSFFPKAKRMSRVQGFGGARSAPIPTSGARSAPPPSPWGGTKGGIPLGVPSLAPCEPNAVGKTKVKGTTGSAGCA